MKKTLLGILAALALLPVFAAAQSSSSSAQIASLMAQIAQLQAQIQAQISSSSAAVSATTTASNVPAAQQPSYSGTCPALSRTLSLGAGGADVANLQAFLANQGFFAGSVTGFYGKITAAAVGKWQLSQRIVTDTASSTGFGIVGPKTRTAITAACAGGIGISIASSTPKVMQCIPAQPPQNLLCSSSWQPVLDKNGCTMYYQCSISLPSASAPSSTSSTPTASCPFVQKPTCTGTISPFSTDQNGCVTAYVCSVQ